MRATNLARARVIGAETNRDWFFASGRSGPHLATETYSRIRWRDVEPLFLGPVERVGP
jgi:hypothetical protein